MTEIEERVRRGAELMDEKMPGWFLRVDLDSLDMASPCRCVLGQLNGNFFDSAALLWNEAQGDAMTNSRLHGFNLIAGSSCESLESAWKSEIRRRRREKRASRNPANGR